MKMNLKPAFQYQFRDILKEITTFYLAMIAIMVFSAFFLIIRDQAPNVEAGGLSCYEIATCVFVLILGFVVTRSQIRLSLQFGISRLTAFVNHLLCCAVLSILLAVVGELLQAIISAAEIGHSNVMFADLYQMVYMRSSKVEILTLQQHLNSGMMNFCLNLVFGMFGTFFTMLFWRLNRTLTIVTAIAIPILLNGIPFLLYFRGIDFMPLMKWLASSHYHLMLFSVLLAIGLGIINWLLLRRANIKGATVS